MISEENRKHEESTPISVVEDISEKEKSALGESQYFKIPLRLVKPDI